MGCLVVLIFGMVSGEKNYNKLKMWDKALITKILDAPSISCVESLYLELGLIPIRSIIKSRIAVKGRIKF